MIGSYDTLVGEFLPDWPRVGTLLPQFQWWGWLILLLIVILFAILEGAYHISRQRNEAVKALQAIPGTTPDSPKVAQPQLNFDKVIYRFEKASNEIQVVAELMMSATGTMKVEDVNLVISGKPIACERWIVREVGMGYTLPTVRFMVGNKLTVGEHEFRIKAYADGQWWASRPSSINYDPSILDKAGSQI